MSSRTYMALSTKYDYSCNDHMQKKIGKCRCCAYLCKSKCMATHMLVYDKLYQTRRAKCRYRGQVFQQRANRKIDIAREPRLRICERHVIRTRISIHTIVSQNIRKHVIPTQTLTGSGNSNSCSGQDNTTFLACQNENVVKPTQSMNNPKGRTEPPILLC